MAQQHVVPSSPQGAKLRTLPVIQPYSRQNCEEKITSFRLQQFHETRGQIDPVENSRTEILLQAAQADDSIFMFIHQVVSLNVVNPGMMPSILRHAPGFLQTMALMNSMLAGDDIKSQKLLEFYANLPCPLNYLAMEAPENYQMLLSNLKYLSHSLQSEWINLKTACLQRGYPPLATELWCLNMYSPALMDVFFLAVARQVWPNSSPNYVDRQEQGRQIFEESKQMLYSSIVENWHLPQVARNGIQHIFHQRFQTMAAQIAGRHLQPAQVRQVSHSNHGRHSSANGHANHATSHSPQITVVQPPVGQHRNHPPLRPEQVLQAAGRRTITPIQPVQQNTGLLIPPADAPRPNQAATATWTLSALHQAHLRDPRFEVDVNVNPSEQLYQSVHAFAAKPRRLSGANLIQTYGFSIPTAASIAATIDPEDGQRKVRVLTEESLQFRFRIVKVGSPIDDASNEDLEQDWVLKPTYWPSNFYYFLNGHELEPRRKQHHTKDLPIDITEFVHGGGQMNTLEIFANISWDEAASCLPQFAFTVEVIGANYHKSILEQCQNRTISSEASLNVITTGLKRHAPANGNEDDDDIMIDDARTNIQIYDPISQGKICALPTRGENCKHRECFDLLTFLQTRPREQPGWPTEADAWKCPICLADVRPQKMIIDGFLKEVGEHLVREGKEKTRVIVVEANGKWTPKIEEGLDSARTTPEIDDGDPSVTNTANAVTNGTPVLPPPAQQPKKRVEVIVLDDD